MEGEWTGGSKDNEENYLKILAYVPSTCDIWSIQYMVVRNEKRQKEESKTDGTEKAKHSDHLHSPKPKMEGLSSSKSISCNIGK